MKILAIETSCDETAISLVDFKSANKFEIIFDSVLSQIEIHKKYGGVYPKLAKREHEENLFPLFFKTLEKSGFLKKRKKQISFSKNEEKILNKIFFKNSQNEENLKKFFLQYQKPKINALAVTYGPGLEIALWSGFNFAKAFCQLYKIDFIPVNHMEGHIYSSLIFKKKRNSFSILKTPFPRASVLISGGHTEIVLEEKNFKYKKIGKTLDDAVGEAYDKSARLLGIAYPGGPEISKLAEEYKKIKNKKEISFSLPRPMINSKNLDFSFSGLKTAVLMEVKKRKKLNKNFKRELSFEFENAVSEVLIKKTKKALEKYKIKSLIIGGGVSANNNLRKNFKALEKEYKNLKVFLPEKKYTGDNALMIAVAGFFRYKNKNFPKNVKKVDGKLNLEKINKSF